MSVACAMALERSTDVDATSWLKMPAIAKATNSTPWVNVVCRSR